MGGHDVDLDQVHPGGGQRVQRPADGLGDVLGQAVEEPGQRDAQPQHAGVRHGRRGGPGDDLVQQDDVGHRAGQRADGVAGAGDPDQPLAAAPAADGGPVADDAAVRGRHPDRAAGVGAQGHRHDPAGHRDRGPAGGPAGRPGGVEGVADRAVGGVVAGDAEGQLVQVGLADHGGTGPAELGDRVVVAAGAGAVQRGGAAAGGQVRGVHVVLDRDGDAGQRALRREVGVHPLGVDDGEERAEVLDGVGPGRGVGEPLRGGAAPGAGEVQTIQPCHARDCNHRVGDRQVRGARGEDAQRPAPGGTGLCVLVGVTGFEPAASSSRTTRATKLRHTPRAVDEPNARRGRCPRRCPGGRA